MIKPTENQSMSMPAPTAKTVLMDRVMTPAIWLSIGIVAGMMLAKKKKVRAQ